MTICGCMMLPGREVISGPADSRRIRSLLGDRPLHTPCSKPSSVKCSFTQQSTAVVNLATQDTREVNLIGVEQGRHSERNMVRGKQLRLHLETNRIDCNYINNTINNININTRASPRLEKLKPRKSTVSISKARENKASRKSSIHTSQ